jgi:hypothetical protein
MAFLKKYGPSLLLTLFFIFIFWVSIVPLRDYDTWFHIKSGEILAQKGIIHYDVFSNSAHGREWFPYEWLFQITVYFLQQVFGFESIKYFIAAVTTIQIGAFYLLLRKVLKINFVLSLSLSFIFLASIFESVAARPYILAYTFLIMNLGLILLYYFKGKNYLWITLPLTVIWANLHGSIFLSVALFAGYTFICALNFIFFKNKEWLTKLKVLGIYSFVTAILTILPPLGFLQYRLLWIFFKNEEFISHYIDEWSPLGTTNPIGFMVYTGTVVVLLTTFVLVSWKKKTFKQSSWTIPLLPFVFLPYSASRNIYLGYIALILILGWSLSKIKFDKLGKYLKMLSAVILIVFISLHIWILYLKKQPQRFYYPINAVTFLKNHHLEGNMFNEYGYGGYLLYQLYPEYQVFFDGRTDVYLCCEMPDTLKLATDKFFPDDKYREVLNQLWNKYHISFVLLRTEKNNILRKIARILTDDPNWNLVFWDDYTQIFVRKDGKNDSILAQFGTKAATPYNKDPYKKGMEDQAFLEYQRMIGQADSAKSRNALGYLLLQKGEFEKAQAEFEKATFVDPQDESPYMNLGELAVRAGNLDLAISLYQKAKTIAPDRGLIYIRLGQIMIADNQSPDKAKAIWEEGLKNVQGSPRDQLQQLLNSY